MAKKDDVKPGDLTFGGALLRGVGLTVGAAAAFMLIPLASDIYKHAKDWLLWEPPSDGLG